MTVLCGSIRNIAALRRRALKLGALYSHELHTIAHDTQSLCDQPWLPSPSAPPSSSTLLDNAPPPPPSFASSVFEFPHLQDPVTIVIQILDALQTHTGLPWWLTIASCAGALRLAMLPLTIQQARAAEMNIPLARLASQQIMAQGSTSGRLGKFFKQWALLREHIGAPHPSWLIMGPLIQIPSLLTCIWAVRSMCLDHWPGLAQGGVALIALDLTAPAMEWGGAGTPHGAMGVVLPVVFGLLVKHNLEQLFGLVVRASPTPPTPTSPTPPPPSSPTRMRTMLLGGAAHRGWLSDIGAVVTMVGVPSVVAGGLLMPQGVLVYVTTSSMCSFALARTLRLPAVRQYMGLPPLGQPPPWLTTLPSVNTMTDHTPHDTANVQYTHTIYPHNMQYTHNTNTPSNTFHPGALPPGEHTTPTQHETPPQHTKLTITCYDPEAAARSAVDPMVEAFAANEHDVDSLFWKAAELRALGKLADALHVLQRILHLQPSNARALFAQGQILSRARRWQESCASFSASARVQEDGVQRARAWLGAGVAAKMGGEDGVALDALDRAERLLMEIAGGREGGGGGDVGTSGVGTTHQHDDDGGMQKQHHDDAVHAGVPAGVAGLLMHVHMTRAAVLKGRGDGAAADGIVAEIAKNHPEAYRALGKAVDEHQ